jgi:catechol 2,3-dioxygenase-like lactoylglutathione lyase family enzyme
LLAGWRKGVVVSGKHPSRARSAGDDDGRDMETAGGRRMEGNGELHAKGILHFTISVRDHVKASEFYADLLGCEVERVSNHFAFMKAGSDYFVLYKNPEHVSPNAPKGTRFHHAFIVTPEEFDRARDLLTARGIEELQPGTQNHRSFPGRHIYFHDPDGNGIEITDVMA